MNDAKKTWTGPILSLLLPGAGQFFAGARLRGMVWFLLLLPLPGVVLWLLSEPSVSSIWPALGAAIVALALWVWMLLDARKGSPSVDAISWAMMIVAGAGLALFEYSLWTKYVATVVRIPNNSMAPTLTGGTKADPRSDRVAVQRCAYRSKEPQRGDVVLFKIDGLSAQVKKGVFAFRVAGLPGEKIAVVNGRVFIDDRPAPENSVLNRFKYAPPQDPSAAKLVQGGFFVAPDCYFLLGDNSAESFDCRYWGPVPRANILGRVTRVCWPASRVGSPL